MMDLLRLMDTSRRQNIGPHPCIQCPRRFPTAQGLAQHMKTHSTLRPFRCPHCDHGFNFAHHLKAHLRTHSGERPYSCRLCARSFSQLSACRSHERKHNDPSARVMFSEQQRVGDIQASVAAVVDREATMDEVAATSTGNCLDVQNVELSEVKPPPFTLKPTYLSDNHVVVKQEVSSGILKQPFRCQFCSKKFAKRKICVIHELTHARSGESDELGAAERSETLEQSVSPLGADQQHACDECGRCFNSSTSLKRHSHVHRREALRLRLAKVVNETAMLVGEADDSQKDSVEEGRTSTSWKYAADTEVQQPLSTVEAAVMPSHDNMTFGVSMNCLRPFQCYQCHKSFASLVDLRQHSRTHSSLRPYKCVCGRGFNFRHHLTTHQRVHTGERPYACALCAKSFTQVNTLRTHERMKHSQRPCVVCRHVCEDDEALSVHMAQTHNATVERPFACNRCSSLFKNEYFYNMHCRRAHC